MIDAKARTTQDAFQEALRSEFTAGAGILSSWIEHLRAGGEVDSLFEFEVWVRGLCAFFDCRHLPLEKEERESILARNFVPEIRILQLVLQEIERCALGLCKAGQDAKIDLEAISDSHIYRAGILDSQAGKLFEQSTPMDSLDCLVESINDLKLLIAAVKDPLLQDYGLYLCLGRTFHRDLRNCRYLDLLLRQRFRPEYDRIDNAALSNVLKSIPEEILRRNVTLALLYLYRFLRYLKLISNALAKDRPLHMYLVVFSLLHEQAETLCDFFRSRFMRDRMGKSRLHKAASLIVQSLRMETQRVFERELVRLSSEKDAAAIYAKVENSHGLLNNCYQNCIVSFVQAFDEKADGTTLFPALLRGMKQGQKLRQDLWEMSEDLKAALEETQGLDLSRVLDRIARFRESSLRLLMYQDWGEFERCSEALITAGNEVEARVLLRKFVGFLEVLIQEVSKRSVLQ